MNFKKVIFWVTNYIVLLGIWLLPVHISTRLIAGGFYSLFIFVCYLAGTSETGLLKGEPTNAKRKKKSVDIIREMNPGADIPTGAEMAQRIREKNESKLEQETMIVIPIQADGRKCGEKCGGRKWSDWINAEYCIYGDEEVAIIDNNRHSACLAAEKAYQDIHNENIKFKAMLDGGDCK